MTDPEGTTSTTQALNERQREAVAYNGGPLVVLAGPGTGKTRVITHRIERIIKSGAEPESVVALTFTVKAAEELRARLRELVGGPAADRINAHTFHGFGQRLIRRFPDLIGVPPEFMLIDPAQRLRIARRLAREHRVFEGALAEGLQALLQQALAHIDAFQHQGRFPDECHRFAAEWAARLAGPAETDDAARAGQVSQERFARFVNLYRLFADECRRAGQLTYEDLILLPVRLLRDHPDAAAICRTDYTHFVVDEFQDVNAGQIELLRLLCPPASRRPPDLCVVGDDDQSIYLFRGADDRAFAKFARLYPDAPTIPLTENYRSEDPILRAAAAVIAVSEHRFASDKLVRPCEETLSRPPAPGAGVECVETPDETCFGEVIAAMIRTDRAAHPDRPWSSFAVIGRTYTDLDRIAEALAAADIPFTPPRAPSALDDDGVKDVLAWVELLVDPAAPWAAHHALMRPPLSLPAAQVQRWLISFGAERSRHRAGDAGRPDPGAFCGWLAARSPDDPGVGQFLALLAALQGPAMRMPADKAILEIIRATGIAYADLPPSAERTRRAGFLADLLRFARDRAPLFEPPGGLRAFWSYFRDLNGDQEPFRGDDEDRVEGSRADPGPAADAVAVITAHKAKGLEFDTVFIPRVSPQHGFPKTSGDGRLALPPDFEDRAGDDRDADARALDEERRLFYVACTRAERRLVLLAKGMKSRSSSTHFFQELALDHPSLVTVAAAEDIYARAERAGVRPAPLAAHLPLRAGRAGILDRARRDARLGVAGALDALERPTPGGPPLDGAVTRFRDHAAMIAVAGHLARSSSPPEWARDFPEAARALSILAARLAGDPEGGRRILQPMSPPLSLSFTVIDQFERCPRCFFLQRVLGFPSEERPATTIGVVAHKALHEFFSLAREHEARGELPPGPTELCRLGRESYFRALAPGEEADPDRVAQLTEMLRLAGERLHRPTDEIAELELSMRFDYEHEGRPHHLTAKFDRIDLLPAGGHRIIDYKTGRARDTLFEPKPDDLQLGIYALALRHHQGIPLDDRAAPARGIAEYWHLPTGRVGRIDLAAIDYDRIRGRIGRAVDGMLAGAFDRKKDCEGLCSFIDPDA